MICIKITNACGSQSSATMCRQQSVETDVASLKEYVSWIAGFSHTVTLHSATNVGFDGKNEAARIVLKEKLRWKNITMLIVDEISQVGGLVLAAEDGRLR